MTRTAFLPLTYAICAVYAVALVVHLAGRALATPPEPVTATVTLRATVAPESRRVACIEAEPGTWHVVGDLTPDGERFILTPVE